MLAWLASKDTGDFVYEVFHNDKSEWFSVTVDRKSVARFKRRLDVYWRDLYGVDSDHGNEHGWGCDVDERK
jgi:hypothetical protein